MKYAWTSITKSCTNAGNFLIEYNLKKILEEKGIREPAVVLDAFDNTRNDLDKLKGVDFIFVPGCTTLSTHHYPALKKIIEDDGLSLPIYNIGAAFFGQPHEDSIALLKRYFSPIGTRDPLSDEYLKKHDIETMLIGCPTLFSGKAESLAINDSNKVLFVFGLNHFDEQIELVKKIIAAGYRVTTIAQEKHQVEIAAKAGIEILDYSPEALISAINESRIVVTGRLHAALPAIACGIPVYFINTLKDSRFSLLEYLGLKLNSIDSALNEIVDIVNNPESSASTIDYTKVISLRKSFLQYIDIVLKDIRKSSQPIA